MNVPYIKGYNDESTYFGIAVNPFNVSVPTPSPGSMEEEHAQKTQPFELPQRSYQPQTPLMTSRALPQHTLYAGSKTGNPQSSPRRVLGQVTGGSKPVNPLAPPFTLQGASIQQQSSIVVRQGVNGSPVTADQQAKTTARSNSYLNTPRAGFDKSSSTQQKPALSIPSIPRPQHPDNTSDYRAQSSPRMQAMPSNELRAPPRAPAAMRRPRIDYPSMTQATTGERYNPACSSLDRARGTTPFEGISNVRPVPALNSASQKSPELYEVGSRADHCLEAASASCLWQGSVPNSAAIDDARVCSRNGCFIHLSPPIQATTHSAASSFGTNKSHTTSPNASFMSMPYPSGPGPALPSIVVSAPETSSVPGARQEVLKSHSQKVVLQKACSSLERNPAVKRDSTYFEEYPELPPPRLGKTNPFKSQAKGLEAEQSKRAAQTQVSAYQTATYRHSKEEERMDHTARQNGSSLTGSVHARRDTSRLTIPPQTTNASTAASPGSWSHSKRWTSQPTKERIAYQKLTFNLQHIGASKSPFVPQSPAELAAFRADVAEANTKRLVSEVKRKSARIQNEAANGRGKDGPVQHEVKLLSGKQLRDNLSVLFASENCFNEEHPDHTPPDVSWPSLIEFKEEGDKRAMEYNRFLPLPRANVVSKRALQLQGNGAYNTDGSIPWEKREVRLNTYHMQPVTAPEPQPDTDITLGFDELPAWMQTLLGEIDHDYQVGESNRTAGGKQ